MLWIIPAWIVSLVVLFMLGYHLRGIVKKVEQLEEVVKSKVDKKPIPEEPESIVIDPTDPIQQAMFEQREIMRKMNPNE